jgi:hypothetical protein
MTDSSEAVVKNRPSVFDHFLVKKGRSVFGHLAVLVALAGCAEPRHEEATLRVIAVLPFVDQTGGASFDGDEFANILASELVKAGFRVIRPAQMGSVTTTDEALRAGRRLRADAIVACAITEYDPYDPPKVAIAAQILRVEATAQSGQNLDRMLQSGSWRRGPLEYRAGHALAAFEEVFDSRDRETRRALQEYVEGRPEAARDVLAVQSRYLQFVSSRMVWRMMAHGT